MKNVREWIGRNNPETIRFFCQHLALEMAVRLKEMLQLVSINGYEKLVVCSVNRFAACLLSSEFTPEDNLDSILDIMCNFEAAQGSMFFGLVLVAEKIQLNISAMHKYFYSNNSRYPTTVDENRIHSGFKACKEYFEKECNLVHRNNFPDNSIKKSLPTKKIERSTIPHSHQELLDKIERLEGKRKKEKEQFRFFMAEFRELKDKVERETLDITPVMGFNY